MSKGKQLVSVFDSLMSCCEDLNHGIEAELVQFLEHDFALRDRLVSDHDDLLSNHTHLEKSVSSAQTERRHIQMEIERLEADKKQLQMELHEVRDSRHGDIRMLETEKKRLETQLFSARNCIELEEQKRGRVTQEKNKLEQQITVIRQVLLERKGTLNDHDRDKISFLTTNPIIEESPVRGTNNKSVLSDDGIDYDVTEEDLDSPRYGRRRSRRKQPTAPPEEEVVSPKRYRKTEENAVVTTTTITVAADGKPISANTEVTVQDSYSGKMLNRSFSEPGLDKMTADYDTSPLRTPGTPGRNNNSHRAKTTMRTPCTPGLRKTNSASSGLNRMHTFVSETVIRPRTCVPCGRRIGFGKMSMKCKECRSVCHAECKDNLPLPCYQAPATPGKVTGGGLLSDYCRVESPMIPGLVIHCVNEVEARGLEETGIYRISGIDREVKELKEKFFKGRGLPNLSHLDIHVACCCLKDFLRNLKEPIVTYKLWKEFVDAAENRDRIMGEADLYQALSQLPRANMDTLSFLMLHLHRVSQSPETMMPVMNLCKVFGPTLIGHSTENPEPLQVIKEIKCQGMVMQRLFDLPEDYWTQFMKETDETMYNNTQNTPNTPGVPRSMLGPVHTPGSSDGQLWTRNTYSARGDKHTTKTAGPSGKTKRPNRSRLVKNFFQSPKLGPEHEY